MTFKTASFTITVFVLMFAACKDNSFSGGGASRSQPSPSPAQLGPNGQPLNQTGMPGGSPGPSSSPGAGFVVSASGCLGAQGIADPNATDASMNQRHLVSNFINSLGSYTHINTNFLGAGALQNEPTTANKICNLKGFKESISTKQGEYSSCKDNYVFTWDASMKNFRQDNACKANNMIDAITCRGRLVDPCNKNKQWVFQ